MTYFVYHANLLSYIQYQRMGSLQFACGARGIPPASEASVRIADRSFRKILLICRRQDLVFSMSATSLAAKTVATTCKTNRQQWEVVRNVPLFEEFTSVDCFNEATRADLVARACREMPRRCSVGDFTQPPNRAEEAPTIRSRASPCAY